MKCLLIWVKIIKPELDSYSLSTITYSNDLSLTNAAILSSYIYQDLSYHCPKQYTVLFVAGAIVVPIVAA